MRFNGPSARLIDGADRPDALSQPNLPVAFIFPSHNGSAPTILWSQRSILSASSPYFRTMLASEMAEGKLTPAGTPVDDGSPPVTLHTLDDPRKVGLAIAAHRVVVKDAPVAAFRCVLLWLLTGDVKFDRPGVVADDAMPCAGAKDVYVLAVKFELDALKVSRRLDRPTDRGRTRRASPMPSSSTTATSSTKRSRQ